ncbi:PAS domain-containing sensor histidine kinase [Geovibrio thiophilus]|uniref:histidine kinase n=1 Tax=Geovibrio thiophilus TaxID=139438 RepID=A0A410JZG5_9BACT|nr:PAS domain S-box protein [Geovibrio thiophilus]QAR33554.1 PAS domain-containing sensor histidine kinase [Geovibrio thiophilus]
MLNLKRNIITNILISAAVPALIFIAFAFGENVKSKEKLAAGEYSAALKISAAHLENYLGSRINNIALLAETPVVKSMNWQEIRPFLLSELERRKSRFDSFILSPAYDGRGIFYSTKHGSPFKEGFVSIDDSSPDSELLSLKDKQFWKSTVTENTNRRTVYVSLPETFYFSDTQYLVTAAAILDKEGKTAGMISGNTDWSSFRSELEESILLPIISKGSARILISDSYGRTVYDSGEKTDKALCGEINGGAPDLTPLLGRILKEKSGVAATEYDGQSYTLFFEKTDSAGLIITAYIPAESIFPVKRTLITVILPSAAAIILSSLLIAFFLYRRLEKKLTALAQTINPETLTLGDKFSEMENEPELAELAQSIRKITEKGRDSLYSSEVIASGINGMEYWLGADSSFIFLSTGCYELTGYTDEELIKTPALLDRMVYDTDTEKWFTQKYGAETGSGSIRIRLRKKNGKVIWAESTVKQVKNRHGQPEGIRGSLINIDRFVTAENMFNENEQLFRKVFIKNTAVMMLIDPVSGIIHDINNAAEKFYQTEKDKLINKSIMDFIHGRDRDFSFSLERFIHQGTVTQELPDGSVRETEIHSTLLKFKDHVQLFLIIYDITNKMELQKKISESEQLFRALSEKVPVGIVVFSDKIHYANPMACEISGFTQREIESVSLWELVSAEQQSIVRNSCFSVTGSKGVTKKLQDIRLNRRDGVQKNIFMTISGINYEGKQAALATFTDISEIKEVQHQLERKIAAEVEKHRQQEIMFMSQSRLAAMGEMLGSIAHQWRQPLNTIGLYVQDLEDAFEHKQISPDYVRETVQKTMLQISMLSKTIDDFSGFYKPKDSRTIFSAVTAAADAARLIAGRLISDKISLSLITEGAERKVYTNITAGILLEDSSFLVQGYLSDFKQVILTVLKNAVDAVNEKRGTAVLSAPAEITIEADRTESEIIIRIRDNGTGVPPEYIEKTFNPYFTTKEQGKGLGLGLYMSKTVIENNMNGHITLENTDDGAVLTIVLPRAA